MIQNAKIVQLSERDAPEIAIFVGKYTSVNKITGQLDSMYANTDTLKLRLQRGLEIILAAKNNDEIIGMISGISNTISNPKNDSWSLTLAYVNEPYRNNAIGGHLLDEFIACAKAKDSFKINVTVMCEDVRTQILFVSRGFKQEGYIEHGREKGADIIFYGKSLV